MKIIYVGSACHSFSFPNFLKLQHDTLAFMQVDNLAVILPRYSDIIRFIT
jgi:hypothetical protein